MKSSRHLWLLLAFLGKIASAQNITSAEYFFDHDPGVGNGTAITIPSPGTTVNLNTKISTLSLSPGIHYLFIRTKEYKHDTAFWSIVQGREFLIPSTATLTQYNIVKAEYYFDHDPGVGNGTPLPSFTGANTVNVAIDKIPTGSLSPGIHYLFVRAQNNSGSWWSIVQGREFLIPSTVSLTQYKIVKAEYYFDHDPGVGNGTPLPSFTAGNTVNVPVDKIPTASLAPGIHYLFVRAQNNAGSWWSIVEGREFLIPSTATLTQYNIVKAEYYFDHDPGVGNGTPLPSFTGANTVNIAVDNIPTASLAPGIHYLFIRAENDGGSWWSIIMGREFLIQNPVTLRQHKIVKAEYFIDTDPGIGNGTPVSPSFVSNVTVDTVRKLGVSNALSLGRHYLFMRAQNDTGKWSIVLYDTFHVETPVAVNVSVLANELCNGGSTGDASVTASGGTSPYTYSWSNGTTTNPTGLVLSAGTFTVTVTDHLGETSTAAVTITQPTAVGVSISSVSNVSCNVLGSATASAATGGTSPYTYSWSPSGGSNITATGLSVGTYTVTVSDRHGCTGSATATISQPPSTISITISSVTNVSCNGGTGNITAHAATGGTAPYTYSWSPAGGTNLTATGLSAGIYTINVTDSHGCTATAASTITQPSSILFENTILYSFTGTIQNLIVPAGITQLTITAAGGAGGSDGLVYAGGGNGAIVTGKCNVTPGDNLSIFSGGEGYNYDDYNFFPGGGGGASGVYDATALNLLIIGGGGGGSTSNSSGGPGGTDIATNTTTNSNPYANAAGGTGGNGGSINLPNDGEDGAGGAGWNSNGTNSISSFGGGSDFANGLAGGTSTDGNGGGFGGGGAGSDNNGGGGGGYNGGGGGYTTTIGDFTYDGGGGGGGSYLNGTLVGTPVASDTGNGYTIISYPTFIAVNQNINCHGGNNGSLTAATFEGGTSPYTYSWSGGGGTGTTATGLTAGTYTLTVSDNHGCSSTISATITQPVAALGVLISSVSNVSCHGGTGNATAAASGGSSPYTYSWSGGGGSGAVTTALTAGTYTISVNDNHGCSATASATITQPASILGITISSVTDVSCSGTGSATASAATGGTSPYTYSWSSAGGTGLTVTGISAGTYTISATDNHGCTATAAATITQPALSLGISLSSVTNILCFGGTGNSTANAATGGTSPYTYSWSGGGGTSLATTTLSAGTYTITVTDNHGCNAVATATVTQPASALGITISSVADVSCHGGTGTVTANAATGGTSPYTYSWSNGGGSNLASTALSAGTYTITVSDNHGCTSTLSSTITQPASSLGISVSSTTNASCHGGTGTITANTATGGTSPYTYSWSGGGGTNLISTSLSAGTYTITTTDNHGCSGTASATITQPASAIGITIASITDISCNGEGSATANAATGGTSPYTYSWSAGRGTALSATGLSAGTYTITASDSHGCSATASATITEPANSLGIVISTITNISCFGGTGSITAHAASGGTSPYTYSWSSGGGTNLSISSVSAGIYTVTVTDNHGCTSSVSSTITQPVSSLGITIASITEVTCHGGTGIITANSATGGTPPYTYSWSSTGGTNVATSAVSAGTYTITVKDNHGCSSTASATITQPASALGISISGVTNVSCNGGTGSATATAATGGTSPYTYSWSNGGGTNLSSTSLSAGTYTITVTDKHGCSATSSTSITQPAAALSVRISAFSNVNCNGGTGSATASAATGGTSPYTYSWSGAGGTNLSVSAMSAGTYTITATDNHGCTATAAAIITQPASSLGISIATITDINCNGGTGSATASSATGGTAPYTYSWSGAGGTNLTLTSVSAGTYTLTVSDNHDCTVTTSAIITQPASAMTLSISSISNVSCNGGMGSVTANAASGGTSPYTYSWSGGGGSNLSTIAVSSGTYTITATDNHGCSFTVSAIITQPASVLSISIASESDVSCNGGTGNITANAATGGTSPYTYSWSDGGGTNNIATVTAGTYTITVIDNNGCTATSRTSITQPATVLGITITTESGVSCFGGANGKATAHAATGGTLPYTYNWTPSGGTNLTASNLSAGIYTITVTDSHGCTATVAASITQPSTAVTISISSQVNISCFGDRGNVTANVATGGNSPYTYRWSPSGGTSLTATNLIAGIYTITATDNNGCTATVGVTITQPAAALGISASPSQDVSCYGEDNGKAVSNASTGGTSPYTYSWSPSGGSNLTATGLSAGSYTITTTDNHGCTATARVIITQPAAMDIRTDSVNETSLPCNGAVSVSSIRGGTAPYTYSWISSGQTTSSINGLCHGIYCCVVTDNHGCSQTVCVTILNPQGVGIENINNSSLKVNIYPNPNKGQFTVEGVEKGMMIEVYDYIGQKISSMVVTNETMHINISTEANGVYLVRIISKDGTMVTDKKIVKIE